MKPSLQPLLKIRAFRERKAIIQVKEHRRKLAACKAEVSECEQVLKQFQNERPQMEQDLLVELQSAPICPKGLQDYLDKLRMLGEQETKLVAQVQQAMDLVEKARNALQEARQFLQTATKGKEKMENLVADQLREIQVQEAFKEDSEIEELAHCFGKHT